MANEKFYASYKQKLKTLGEEVKLLRYIGEQNNFTDVNYILYQYEPSLVNTFKNQQTVSRVIQRLLDKGVLVQYEQGRYFKEGINQVKNVNKKTIKGTAGEYRTNKTKAQTLFNQYQELVSHYLEIVMYMSGIINLDNNLLNRLEMCELSTNKYNNNKQPTLFTTSTSVFKLLFNYLSMYVYNTYIFNYLTDTTTTCNITNNLLANYHTFYSSIISNTNSAKLYSTKVSDDRSGLKAYERDSAEAMAIFDKMYKYFKEIEAVVSLDLDLVPDDALLPFLETRKWDFCKTYSTQPLYHYNKYVKEPSVKICYDKDVTYEDILGSYQEQMPFVRDMQKSIDEQNNCTQRLLQYKFIAKVKSKYESTLRGKQEVWDGKKSANKPKNVSIRLTCPLCNTANDIEHPDKWSWVTPDDAEAPLLRSEALRLLFGESYEAVEGRTYFDINASVHRLTMSYYAGRYIRKEEVPDVYSLLAGKELDRKTSLDAYGNTEREVYKKFFNILYYCWVYSTQGSYKAITNKELSDFLRRRWLRRSYMPVSATVEDKCKLADANKDASLSAMVLDRIVQQEDDDWYKHINEAREQMVKVYGGKALWVKVFAIESAVMWVLYNSLKEQGFESAIVYDCIYTDKPLAKTEEEANAKFEEELAKAFDIVYQQIKVEEE